MPPSPCDESLPTEQAHERRAQYINIMTHVHSIRPVIAVAVARLISPSTSSTLRKFNAAEIVAEYEDRDDESEPDSPNACRLFGAPLSTPAIEMLMPLAAEFTDAWMEVFEYLGWGAEHLMNEVEVAGKPTFCLTDPSGVSSGMPVYLVHELPAPTFDRQLSEYPTIRLLQCACLGDFMSDWSMGDNPGFLLLAAYPQLTIHNDRYYCYVGKMYDRTNHEWLDLLLSRNSQDVLTLLEQSRKVRPGFQGASKLGSATDNFGKRIALLLSGFTPGIDDCHDWGVLASATDDGWSMVKAFSFEDYDIEDLEPYMLAPLRRF
ncbi:hypothetical protein NPS53_07930 [Pseudomonas putida]|uniref:hypothetical protein n=1 Tax=Pseudomonas putida TaxID=303 RepID=UPI00236418B2|nr:hypothetical protein [Pseudomonas putida]MDD2139498.1 hypothetical protein [Pseudomonas putida]HDS1721826.1 hypothetical protein [Pseudomonas putida]